MHRGIETSVGGGASVPVFNNLLVAADGRPADINRLLKLSIPNNIDSLWQLRIEEQDITQSNDYVAHKRSSDENRILGWLDLEIQR